MKGIVLDASVALAWALHEENPGADPLLDLCKKNSVHIPSLFLTELMNGLVMAERRKRITSTESNLFWRQILRLDFHVAAMKWTDCETIRELAREEALTVYDATYLQLALASGFALASFDSALRSAAIRRTITVL